MNNRKKNSIVSAALGAVAAAGLAFLVLGCEIATWGSDDDEKAAKWEPKAANGVHWSEDTTAVTITFTDNDGKAKKIKDLKNSEITVEHGTGSEFAQSGNTYPAITTVRRVVRQGVTTTDHSTTTYTDGSASGVGLVFSKTSSSPTVGYWYESPPVPEEGTGNEDEGYSQWTISLAHTRPNERDRSVDEYYEGLLKMTINRDDVDGRARGVGFFEERYRQNYVVEAVPVAGSTNAVTKYELRFIFYAQNQVSTDHRAPVVPSNAGTVAVEDDPWIEEAGEYGTELVDEWLLAKDVSILDGPSGNPVSFAVKGTVDDSRSTGSYFVLPLDVYASGTIYVSIDRWGIAAQTESFTLSGPPAKYTAFDPDNETGDNGVTTSTIRLSFAAPVAGLSDSHINVYPNADGTGTPVSIDTVTVPFGIDYSIWDIRLRNAPSDDLTYSVKITKKATDYDPTGVDDTVHTVKVYRAPANYTAVARDYLLPSEMADNTTSYLSLVFDESVDLSSATVTLDGTAITVTRSGASSGATQSWTATVTNPDNGWHTVKVSGSNGAVNETDHFVQFSKYLNYITESSADGVYSDASHPYGVQSTKVTVTFDKSDHVSELTKDNFELSGADVASITIATNVVTITLGNLREGWSLVKVVNNANFKTDADKVELFVARQAPPPPPPPPAYTLIRGTDVIKIDLRGSTGPQVVFKALYGESSQGQLTQTSPEPGTKSNYEIQILPVTKWQGESYADGSAQTSDWKVAGASSPKYANSEITFTITNAADRKKVGNAKYMIRVRAKNPNPAKYTGDWSPWLYFTGGENGTGSGAGY